MRGRTRKTGRKNQTGPIDPFDFWDHVLVGDGCWEWQGSLSGGRGRYRNQVAYRVAWELWHGRKLGAWHCRHSCDNPRCVRPDHLRRGTNHQNLREAGSRGLLKGRGNHNRAKTLAKCGHPFTRLSAQGYRECGPCRDAYHRQRGWSA